ncbi:receptor-type tyrosine-protein phosphatase C isoform X4 [Megalobrama amblycephala]|uniref:receptor-type tyrosine-protein phosphatase C isoform X4 n=1 Tax=Megalobrama amblycephala TaxID=75352 RepID=UPI002013E285|nr:receptor-type tyrosine-protein phosphatase C isoform X4 [Megalobrama amblycephala]
MARFFALGPLVLVLCLVLCSAKDNQSISSTLISTSNPPAPATEESTRNNNVTQSTSTLISTSNPPAPATEGTSSTLKQTLTVLPSLTPSQQHNTGSSSTLKPTLTVLPSLTPSQQHDTGASSTLKMDLTSVLPSLTPSQQHDTGTSSTLKQTLTVLPSLTPSQQHNTGTSSTLKQTLTVLPSLTPSQQHNTGTSSTLKQTLTVLPSLTPSQQHNTGTSSTLKQTLTVLPSLTPSQQHNTGTSSTLKQTLTVLPSLTPSQQHNTGTSSTLKQTLTVLPSLTPSQQHNTGTSSTLKQTLTVLPSLTPSQQHDTEKSTESNNCTSTSPSRTSSQQHPTKTTAGTEATSSPNTNITLLTSTQSISTSPALTTSMGTTKNCEYTVTRTEKEAIVHVWNVNVSDSNNQTYTIRLMDQDTTVFNQKGSSPFKILLTSLKPCTNYTVEVDDCQLKDEPINFQVDKSTRHSAKIEDEKVCFTDDRWNLTKCFTISNETSCKDMPIPFNLDTCTYTMDVHMPPVKPEITFSHTIPTMFKWSNKPDQCDDSKFKVNCTDKNSKTETHHLNKKVFLVPSEMYSCTGQYESNNTFIESNPKQINISCDFTNKTKVLSLNNNLIEIEWKLSPGNNCSGIHFHFSGNCTNSYDHGKKLRCDTSKPTKVCRNDELHAFTNYTCNILANSNISDDFFYSISHSIRTLPHKPSFTQNDVKVSETSHNSFTVSCKNLKKDEWNGLPGNYIAINKNSQEVKNKTHCSFKFDNLYYLTEYTFEIKAMNGNLNESSVTITRSTRYNDKGVIGFLAFLIIMTSLALLFVLYKIFLLKRKRNDEDEEILLTQPFGFPSPLLEPLRPVEPIYADNLIEAYKTKIADESRLFMDEFQSIPRIFSNYTIKEAKKQENQSKNRYVDILPYDYNRVPLTTGGEREYINASFIEGYQEPKKYIAAQGPKDETIDDFWRMVWEQKSSIIVMVTRCEEGNKIKCAQYWPSLDRETEIFEDFVVKIRAEEHCPDYIIRYLVLANKREKAPEREVTHIQFISWPDHGVPQDPSLLLKLRRRVNSFKNFFSGPVVVHCSAGVGRTGTYIGIDAMIESLEAEGRVDIYGFVAKLRRQRCLMVQVEPQYILIHTALIEHNQFGETEVPLSEFHSALNTLRQKDGSDPSLLEMEFQKLPKFKNWRTFNTGGSEDNKKKNRYSSHIPYDFNRVLFRLEIEGNQTSDPEDEDEYSSDEEEESNEYINASFIDGYWCHKSLIAAQGPLPNTTEEFLLMLYQQQSKTLVMLTDCQEDGKDYCSQYWGDEKKVFGDMEIEVKKTESFPAYVRRHLEIQSTKKKDILKVDQYQFLKWRGTELPENAQELIEMMKSIRENGNYDNSKMNRSIPIVVHCNNGSSRTGIFCALWNLMDSALTEKLVDVFQEIKNLRKFRQGMVETFEQYQFLYTAIEGAFPVQNGAIKTPTATDSAQVINETTALLTKANSTTGADQKEAEDSKATESSEQEATENSAATENSTAAPSPAEGDGEKTTTEGPTNGPAATTTVEV